MRVYRIAALAVSMAFAASVMAGDKEHEVIELAIIADGSMDEVSLQLDSDTMGFSLHDLQEGETRSVIDDSGRPILITRTADGFSFNVDGETIDMPALDGVHGDHTMVMMDGDHDVDVAVHVMGGSEFITSDEMSGVTIISGQAMDDATKDAIRSLIQSGGYGDDVDFVDAEGAHAGGDHEVRIIKKHVEVTQ